MNKTNLLALIISLSTLLGCGGDSNSVLPKECLESIEMMEEALSLAGQKKPDIIATQQKKLEKDWKTFSSEERERRTQKCKDTNVMLKERLELIKQTLKEAE